MLDADMNLAESTVEREEEERNASQCPRSMKIVDQVNYSVWYMIFLARYYGYLTC